MNKQKGIDIMKENMNDIDQDIYDGGQSWDDVTGMELSAKMVKDARQEEMRFFAKRKAYTRVRR